MSQLTEARETEEYWEVYGRRGENRNTDRQTRQGEEEHGQGEEGQEEEEQRILCSICMGDIADKKAKMLGCKHFFHEECLNIWIFKNGGHQCPICKQPIFKDDKADDSANKSKL